ncbi:MAG: aminotransferase [Alphaproteobacteria bacterium]|nr:aminotransferase [Alphaproteobacteria bacterium]
MKRANSILSAYETSVFEVMSRLAREHDAVNLGQGFPDSNGPDDVRQAAVEATDKGPNQYPPSPGLPELRQAVAAHGKRFYGLDIDWQTETLITCGGTHALASCFLGLIEPGDEVVLFEPVFDTYLPMVRRAGAIPKLVRLEPPDWALPRERLRAAFSAKTKLIVVNSPMNPTGKVFDRADLEFVAGLCREFDTFAVCDEVYEHLIFDGLRHIPLMTLPGMRERTVRIGSAGKIFSLTGWKIGFITGPKHMVQPIFRAHQAVIFSVAPSLQKAVAYGLGKDDAFFASIPHELQGKRDRFMPAIARMGFRAFKPYGTYFITADFRPLGANDDSLSFCTRLVTEAGVAAIPLSALYEGDIPQHLIRFAFCKRDEVLDEAVRRMARYFGKA